MRAGRPTAYSVWRPPTEWPSCGAPHKGDQIPCEPWLTWRRLPPRASRERTSADIKRSATAAKAGHEDDGSTKRANAPSTAVVHPVAPSPSFHLAD